MRASSTSPLTSPHIIRVFGSQGSSQQSVNESLVSIRNGGHGTGCLVGKTKSLKKLRFKTTTSGLGAIS